MSTFVRNLSGSICVNALYVDELIYSIQCVKKLIRENIPVKRLKMDYRPVYVATVDVAKGLIPQIQKMPPDFAYEDDDSPEHLLWMVKEIETNPDWPIDKASRWLGYIQGVLRVHRVLSTEIERNRTRSVFHAAYKTMGFKVPDKKQRNTPSFGDPDQLADKWTKLCRLYARLNFFRGFLFLFWGHRGRSLRFHRVSEQYSNDLLGSGGALYFNLSSTTSDEAQKRLDFAERFLARVRKNELKALASGSRLYFIVGSFAFYGCMATLIMTLLAAALGSPWVLVLPVVPLFVTIIGAALLILTRQTRRARNELPKFIEDLPWL